ncbi:TlpA family protein disulfide reductase [Natronobacterium gregoryi]|uniref:Alkyl hydroperoxide reductase/ thiol specific antioxidant/ Mal allergen n=2 Tax=Natronobacterium gregoryi TaxID=44930 RepID=L0AKY4_NATGS|nr:TlpA disulfide reductase family protein [Natronobacterium gregoryi]AFZ74466.1 Redoxin [Natronobacterium gregoryi SP2]ELY72259.1 alkyl hydroperoxide reductase/ thiol specific antioxidant/ Mal allergen [Natronobacterium gregoryi SP2]PLK21786.1 TlpA family protein disulfide reductase [Natronobacterium gregoryi SP2]SFJ45960.1 Redoxin [Natronobacterium gregoryi]
MRRRDVLAGLGSLGILGGAGAVAVYGLPSTNDISNDEGDDGSEDGERYEQVKLETVDAPGSEAGQVVVPAPNRPTFIDFFGTWCPPCKEQMPELAEAHERIGDEVLFVSITSESVGEDGPLTEAELVEWWGENGGNWTLGLDPTAELSYRVGRYPMAVALDDSSVVRWSDTGSKTADEFVAGIENALEHSETES